MSKKLFKVCFRYVKTIYVEAESLEGVYASDHLVKEKQLNSRCVPLFVYDSMFIDEVKPETEQSIREQNNGAILQVF